MFRTVVLTPTPTHPIDFGNRKRINQICSFLRRSGHEVDLLLYPNEAEWRSELPSQTLQEMRTAWSDVHIIPATKPFHPAAANVDHEIDEWWDPAIEDFLRWYQSVRPIDIFFVNYVYLSKAFETVDPSVVKVLDTHDVFTDRRQRLAACGIPPEFFHTTEAAERVGLNRADLLIAIKKEEQPVLEKISERPVVTVPFSQRSFFSQVSASDDADVEKQPDPLGETRPPLSCMPPLKVGFVGAQNNFNLMNLERFFKIALPYLQAHFAPIEFHIAGTICRDLTAYANHQMIRLLGFVENIQDAYDLFDVVVVPQEVSTGQKIKSGEALASGLPIVGHAHAFEGYETDEPYHLCPSFKHMAEALVEIAFDRSKLPQLSRGTIRAQSRHLEYTEKSLRTLQLKILDLLQLSVFIVDVEEIAERPALVFHILSVIQLVKVRKRVATVFIGDLEKLSARERAAFEELGICLSAADRFAFRSALRKTATIREGRPSNFGLKGSSIASGVSLGSPLEQVFGFAEEIWSFAKLSDADLRDLRIPLLVSEHALMPNRRPKPPFRTCGTSYAKFPSLPDGSHAQKQVTSAGFEPLYRSAGRKLYESIERQPELRVLFIDGDLLPAALAVIATQAEARRLLGIRLLVVVANKDHVPAPDNDPTVSVMDARTFNRQHSCVVPGGIGIVGAIDPRLEVTIEFYQSRNRAVLRPGRHGGIPTLLDVVEVITSLSVPDPKQDAGQPSYPGMSGLFNFLSDDSPTVTSTAFFG